MLQQLLGSDAEILPLEVTLWCRGQQYVSVSAHPTDAEGGLPIEIVPSEECFTDWGDGSPVSLVEASGGGHTYTRAGEFVVECWTDGDPRKEATLSVTAVNQRPAIGSTLLYEDAFEWRQQLTVLVHPHVAGCNSATGEYLYDMGCFDPDGDETRKRLRVKLLQEILVGDPDEGDELPPGVEVGDLIRYEVLEEWSVFSIHDRSNVTGQWADVWGFWFQVGWDGSLPPYPFATWTYEALAPEISVDDPFTVLNIGPKDWPGPDWPDCGDCPGDEEPDPDPEETPDLNEVSGDCFVQVKLEVIDRWGGFYGLAWLHDIPSCAEGGCGGSASPPPPGDSGGTCG
jgi:hypothetical protein